jgi:pimeloyl-ACP methyl ester carboxylesterase
MSFIQTNDIQTFYDLRGSGPPLILLHGGFLDHRMWEPQIEVLASQHTVIAYDIRGHGQTTGSQTKNYTVALLVEDLHTLLQQLQVTRPALCGLSLGGMVAQAYSVTYPENVTRLILCDTAASTALSLSDKLQTYIFGWPFVPFLQIFGAHRIVDMALWTAKYTRSEAWLGRNATVVAYVRNCMRSFDTQEMVKIYKLVLRFREQELAQITAPTLIMNGADESANVFRHTEYLRSHIANVQVVTIPNAGHVSNMENPEIFNEQLLSVLKNS